jgi:DNA polymerase-3 subunit gamma/tau
MEHLALYRKWRPQNFKTIIGQDDNVRVLKNAVKSGRTVHAYLFCGTRGTGKTSTARILAKALNCENPVDGEPCNKCEACIAITAGRFMDVIEIDAASNRGIDEIRDLLEKVHFVPVAGKYKVYIIDEAHMLTTEAFNALLKTFEEPPSHVVFILATTEARKVPLTILSRCQRYDFKPINEEMMAKALKNIVAAENMNADDDAIELLAEKAKGSMRDALSLMDQAMGGEKVMTAEELNRLTGSVPYEFWLPFFQHIKDQDLPGVFRDLDQLENDGKDLRQFFRDFRDFSGDLFIADYDKGKNRYEHVLKEAAGLLTPQQILEIIAITGESEIVFRYNRDGKAVCRFLMAKIMKTLQNNNNATKDVSAKPEETQSVPTKTTKIKTETSAVNNYVFPNEDVTTKGQPPTETPPWEDSPPVDEDFIPPESTATPKTVAETKDQTKIKKSPTTKDNDTEKLWADLLKGVKEKNTSTYTWLSHGELTQINDKEITVSYRSGETLYFNKIQEEEHKATVETVLHTLRGDDIRFKPVSSTAENIKEMSLFD